jgi:hypothetical protein
VWAPPLTPLQIADGVGGQLGAPGQFLLRETRGFPKPPQPLCERLSLLGSQAQNDAPLGHIASTNPMLAGGYSSQKVRPLQ